jgi:hypothetical protein
MVKIFENEGQSTFSSPQEIITNEGTVARRNLDVKQKLAVPIDFVDE